jgi:hypothetical protein
MFKICPTRLKEHCNFKMSKKNIKKYGNLKIDHNCDLVKQKGIYYIFVSVPTIQNTTYDKKIICGGDPGIRTFLTIYNTLNQKLFGTLLG